MEPESFGIMNEAYRVSRREILDWINKVLGLSLYKIEQLGTGAVNCQLLEAYFPGSITSSRINWGAKSEHEFVSNFKLLQKGFLKNKFKKNIDITKLTKCRYQDNLEFIQWFKQILSNYGSVVEDYDGSKGRGGADLFYLSKNPNKAKKSILNAKKQFKQNKPSKIESSSTKFKPKLVPLQKEIIEQMKKDLCFVRNSLSGPKLDDEIVEELRDYFGVKKPQRFDSEPDDE